jgi:uncharacterized protein
MKTVDAWSEEAREAAKEARHHQNKTTFRHMSKKERKEWRKSVERMSAKLRAVGRAEKPGSAAREHKSWAISHQAAGRHSSNYDARRRNIVAYDPFGREAVTYVTDPDGNVVAYDPFGREIEFFEEEDSMRPKFSMQSDLFAIVGDTKPSAPTTVRLYDNIEIDDAAKVTFTTDGFLKAMPRIARTGVQVYGGDECGIEGMDTVRVYRSPSAVFDAKAIHSLTHLPTTLEHPPAAVTPSNWKDHATGETGDEVLRDGATIRVPMMLRDAKAIAAFKDGSKKQLSVGYTCDLVWAPGVVPAGEHHAGEAYDAIQQNIRANHLAQCAAARGGPILTIGDTSKEKTMNLKTVMVDGIACEMTDTAAQLVQKTIGTLQATIDAFKKKQEETEEKCMDAVEKLVTADAAIKAKDAEIAVLKKSVEDANDPRRIDERVVAKTDAMNRAKAILGDGYRFDGKSAEQIRRDAVAKHMGDGCKDWTDAQIEAGFAMLPKVAATRVGSIDHAVSVFAGRPGEGYRDRASDPQAIRDAAYAESVRELTDAWKPQAQRDAEALARKAAGY